MKKIMLSAMLAIGLTAAAQTTSATPTYSTDNSHSSVNFAVSHMSLTKTVGHWSDYEVKVTATKDDMTDAVIEMTIQSKSVSTGDDGRDKHLSGADFFDVEKYPTITFKSSALKKVKGNNYKLEGELTMKGVSKKVSFDVVMTGPKKDPWGNVRLGFAVTGAVDRTQFGINWNSDLPEGGKLLDNMVELNAFIELLKK